MVRVRGLDASTTDAKLYAGFGSWHPLRAEVVVDKNTSKSKGWGFITFRTTADAKKAAEEMNGKVLDGKVVRVTLEKPAP